MGTGRAVFLDRDGTINADRPDYVKGWEEFHFFPEALAALRRLARLEVDIIVVTNQSAIGRRVISATVVSEINRRMVSEIERHGGRITAVYVCPHVPWAGCPCRKPKPGLLLRAAARHRIDLSQSFMVGNHISDAEAAVAVGCKPILISPDRSVSEGRLLAALVFVDNLYQATEQIEAALRKTDIVPPLSPGGGKG